MTSPHRPVPQPHTPSRTRDRRELDNIEKEISAKWQLGFDLSGTFSPMKLRSTRAGQAQNKLRTLYWTSSITPTLEQFNARALGLGYDARIELLHSLLSNVDSPKAVPSSQQSAARQLQARLQESKTQTSKDLPTRDRARHSTPCAVTDDEEDWYDACSASPSRRVAQSQAGRRGSGEVPASRGKKRPSESSNEDQTSPKYRRLSLYGLPGGKLKIRKGKNDGRREKDEFQIPSLPVARSFVPSSAETSFTPTSIFSQSADDGTTTANTSFTSNIGDPPVSEPGNRPRMVRSSSTTIGSSDEDLLGLLTHVPPESESKVADPPVPSSSYGSWPERSPSSSETVLNRGDDPLQSRYPDHHTDSPRIPRMAAVDDRELSRTNRSMDPLQPVIPWFIRDMPKHNLFVDDFTPIGAPVPYWIVFICQRIAVEHKVSMQVLLNGMNEANWSSHASLQDHIQNNSELSNVVLEDSKKLWSHPRPANFHFTFKASLDFNANKSGRFLKLKLHPLEPDLSNRFERKFQSHRFLYVALPSAVPKSAPTYAKDYKEKLQEWLSTEHEFLARKWRAFWVEPVKNKKTSPVVKSGLDKKIVLWATEGYGIDDPMSVGEMLNWFYPIDKIKDQPYCKAFSRIKLGLSRTVPTFTFKPSQVRYVDDIVADGTPEVDPFRDMSSSCRWDELPKEGEVMNDGCSVISAAAARRVWQAYKQETGMSVPLPSCFQGRIGGAKGMWMVDGDMHLPNTASDDIWIKISASQLKFAPHEEDKDDAAAWDPHRLTFDLRGYSKPPAPSDLHISFIPILVDRGVSRSSIAQVIVEKLDVEREDFTRTLKEPVRVHDWVFQQAALLGDTGTLRWNGGLPISKPQVLRLLLESGFEPTKFPYLAKTLMKFVNQKQTWTESKLRIPLGKATFLYGVADPIGVLKPGEVHVRFSSEFVDTMTEQGYRCLDKLDILVARQPACRRSDIQRVRAVDQKALAHLVDVVVFPSKGVYPLAGKLQGGDYDGDIFWLCWEPTLVDSFENAPAPLQSLPLQTPYYTIRQDKTRVDQIMDPKDLSTIDGFLRPAFQFNMVSAPLGLATRMLEKQVYRDNCMGTAKQDMLSNMHDLLVDAAKQGYVFSDADFRPFATKLLGTSLPKDPVHKEAMDMCERSRETDVMEQLEKKRWKYNRDNAVDYLYFEVVREHNRETFRQVAVSMEDAVDNDEDLQYTFLHLRKDQSAAVKAELDALEKALKRVYVSWNAAFAPPTAGKMEKEKSDKSMAKCFTDYQAIQPLDPEHLEIKPWVEHYQPRHFTLWQLIKASALYCRYPDRRSITEEFFSRPGRNQRTYKSNPSNFVFRMAGEELAFLKATSTPRSRMVCPDIHSNLKPRPIKTARLGLDGSDDDDDLFELALEEQQ